MTRLKSILIGSAVVLVLGGCASTPPQKSQKELATRQWNSTRANVMAGLAKDQFETHQYDKARQTISEALTLDPDNVPLHVLAARIAIEQNRLDQADASLKRAREINPKDAEANYYSGIVAQRWEKYDEALTFYTTANDAAPSEMGYLMARAEVMVLLDRRADATDALKQQLVAFEHSSSIRDALGQLLMQDKHYTEAAEMFRQASILASDDLSIKHRLAMAQYADKAYADALNTFNKLVTAEPYSLRADVFMAIGECELNLNKFDDARNAFTKATELDRDNSSAWVGLAKAALSGDDLRRAELAIRRAVALDPTDSQVQLAMGYVQLKQKNLDEAMISFKKASLLDVRDSVSLSMIGLVLDKKGRHDEAVTYYAKALQVNPSEELAKQLLTTAFVQ